MCWLRAPKFAPAPWVLAYRHAGRISSLAEAREPTVYLLDMASPDTIAVLVQCRDEPGVLYRIAETILRHGANITYVAGGVAPSESRAELQLEVSGASDEESLLAQLRQVDGVTDVANVPTFQAIYGKRVIVIGGGAQV